MAGRLNSLINPLVVVLALLAAAGPAWAQLKAERTYYGVDRPLPITIEVPSGSAGAVKVQLLEPSTAKVLHEAEAAPGPADLAALFPVLWSGPTPVLMYAQLVVADQKVGPALVLQPMITPAYATGLDSTGTPLFPNEATRPKFYSGLRCYSDQHVILETSKGDITIALRPEVAPNTVWNFRSLVAGGFYTDIAFHRVVAQNPSGQPFVVQMGDPTAKGNGGPGYFFDLEPSVLPHDFGVISMARMGDPNTNGSQIFICLSREGTRPLDGKYCSFGQTIAGADAIQAIAAVPVGPQDRPMEPPVVKSARLVDAPPYGDGPEPVKSPDQVPTER